MAKKILVVDHDKDSSELARCVLKMKGYEVINAYDRKDALVNLKQNPDLVFFEPHLIGFDFYEEMKKRMPGLNIAILTVMAEQEAVKKGKTLGAAAYITKPHDIAHLASAAQELLR